jgi:low affinity Fe/Cu permease
MERSTFLQRISRILHWVGDLTSRSGASMVALVLIVIFGVILAVNGFPSSWETAFSTIVSAFTLIMLFVIQHTQGRHQKVLQLKLDELIRTSPEADDHLVHIEAARDNEILDREQEQVAHHEALRDDAELEIVEFNPGKKP